MASAPRALHGEEDTWESGEAGRKQRGPLRERDVSEPHYGRDDKTQPVQLGLAEDGATGKSFAVSSSSPYSHPITKYVTTTHHLGTINQRRST